MEINLETDEKVKLVVDGTCEFEVWGERNEEGTMILRYKTIFGTEKSKSYNKVKSGLNKMKKFRP